MENIKPSISVLLVTYNHEKTIHQALQSLLGQIFDGEIEVIVADDHSTDTTLEIIKSYEFDNTRLKFTYLENTKNLGITKNYKRGFSACNYEFIAVLEGDDYWISPYKLKKQSDFLKEHWETNLCSTNYWIYEESESKFTVRSPARIGYRLFTARDIIADNIVGNFSTCMYRRTAIAKLPDELFEITSYDWIVNILIARNSLIGFIEEPLSVYRLHNSGTWAQKTQLEKVRLQLELIPSYDKLTNFIFHEDFEELKLNLKKITTRIKLSKSTKRTITPAQEYIPPIIIDMLKYLTPIALKKKIKRMIISRNPE